MRIVAENLTYTYSKKSKDLAVKAINNVNLIIEEGDFFGIIGHTGSGKSTFVQHLNGLIRINDENSTLKIGDFDLTEKKCDFKALRSKIGMVFQYPEYQLFAETVFEDVAFGLKNFFPNMTESEREERVKSAIEKVGLNYSKVKNKSPFELSGGQKRRVAIAGVIVSRPEVLVLDEPVAGLDPKGKIEFLQLLKDLHKDFVKTIIIVSHDMNVVSEYCNKVAVFSNGTIIKKGTPKEVFSDAEDLIATGLDLPLTAQLSKALKEKGINLCTDFTIDSFIDAIMQVYKGGKA